MTLGVLAGIPVPVVQTESDHEICVISFRKATKHESQIYFDEIQAWSHTNEQESSFGFQLEPSQSVRGGLREKPRRCLNATLSRTKMPRPSLPQLLFAFIAGCVLLWLALFAMGFLAALPVPSVLRPLRQSTGWAGLSLYAVLRIHLPMALLAALFAWAAFRLLRAHGAYVALALSAPWLIYSFVEALTYYQASELTPMHKLMLLFVWYKWFARLSVPLGVWVASKVSSVQARDAA